MDNFYNKFILALFQSKILHLNLFFPLWLHLPTRKMLQGTMVTSAMF